MRRFTVGQALVLNTPPCCFRGAPVAQQLHHLLGREARLYTGCNVKLEALKGAGKLWSIRKRGGARTCANLKASRRSKL